MAKIPEVVIRHIIVKLAWPRSIPKRLQLAQTILTKLTGNTYFPVNTWPTVFVSLSQLNTDVTNFATTQTAVSSKTGTVTARDIPMNASHADLESIKKMVQLKADSNPASAEEIILSAGYGIKIVFIHQKQQNGAHNTDVSGTILAIANLTGPHMWQITQDEKTITTLDSTKQAHTLIPGLTPGQVYFVRNKKIPTKNETFDWSPWIMIRVQ